MRDIISQEENTVDHSFVVAPCENDEHDGVPKKPRRQHAVSMKDGDVTWTEADPWPAQDSTRSTLVAGRRAYVGRLTPLDDCV
jgi:hypothetical protein